MASLAHLALVLNPGLHLHSLGGHNRENRLITYRNLMLTMLAGGLWHGAAWTFVLWGGAHGGGQVVQQEYRRQFPPKPTYERLKAVVGWFLTLNFVCLCWILFRASSFSAAAMMVGRYLFVVPGGAKGLPLWLTLFPLALLGLQWSLRRVLAAERITRLTPVGFGIAYGALWAFALSMLPLGYRPFIYFQF